MRRSRDPAAKDAELIRRFMATFEQLDELTCYSAEPPPGELFAGTDAAGRTFWRPVPIATDRDQLQPLYRRLPGHFPTLYEQLVLTYRWLEVDLRIARLLPNPPGPTLSGLEAEILRDPVLINTLLPAGFIPFGRATDVNYDPICFDLNAMKHGDCPIIQFEHEAILCHDKIGETWQRSSSFCEFMCDTIELAQSKSE